MPNSILNSLLLKTLFLLLTFTYVLSAKEITPLFRLHSVGFVSDFVVDGPYLYVANDRGSVDIFDLNTKAIVDQIILEPLTNLEGLLVPAAIHSVDRLHGKTLMVSSGVSGYRNVWIHEKGQLSQVVNETQKLFIKEARFVGDERLMFGTFGSELILYDSVEAFPLYTAHISQSTLGDFVLSASKEKMAMSDESGAITLVDVNTSEVEAVLESQNVDNVYHIALEKDVIITAGQDRRVGVYASNRKAYYIKSDFLVYCVGLSPSAKIGIYSSGEDNNLQLFNVASKQKGDVLVGHKNIITQIKFINEKQLFSSGRGNEILFWQLP